MGGGATLQLSLYGAQDLILSGSPQITFFKLVYRRHTLFSAESTEQIFQSAADFGRKSVVQITKSGDLVNQCWLQITLPALTDYHFGTAQSPTATAPGVKTARWMSSSTARVTYAPPTSDMSPVGNSSIRYCATLDPANENTITAFYSVGDATAIDITGLSSTQTYTVNVHREQVTENDGINLGDDSDTMAIESVRWTNSIGHALIRSAEVEIGGVRIDRHESDYLDIISELTLPEEKKAGFYDMIGKYDTYDLFDNSFQDARTLYVPLQFFFCKSPTMSIPLVSLVYHNVVLNFEFRNYTELIRSTMPMNALYHVDSGNSPSMDCRLYANFVLLDTTERTRFATMPHEYLIEQIQTSGDKPIIVDANNPNLTIKADLSFSHPIKEIVWTYNHAPCYNATLTTAEYTSQGNDWFNYDLPAPNIASDEPFLDARIQLNGHDRTSTMPAKYWRLVQPYQHHTRIPTKKIYAFSYALHPEEMQPSGTCNHSRVDSAYLVLSLNPSMLNTAPKGRLRVFAIGFNVFRVGQGMGGLAFTGS